LTPGRWTHVAVTYDGASVRFYVDGRLDSQHAAAGDFARVSVPLVIGNYLDPNSFSDFSGDLQVRPEVNPRYLFPFDGLMDELRLSSVARDSFPTAERW
jgi:hypothetical protein